ncbi:hypothetical protein [Tritonibacter mobilis]|uniref:hypothetical protein n=1 Tax=Tritonibacter mobilis TaxID=379347 RepID=UPI000806C654|nr:hypothetical protein [Tritonibacter mobilis]GLP85971.1 hypothetical protein GCM10007921_15310 [Tritonibacter mobilis]SDW98316.1 hypothetical protein SAMN05444385_104170 [Tritonibacter mobilis]
MTAYTLPPKLTTFERIIFRVPVLGRIWKEVSYGDEGNIYYAIVTFISLWGISIMLFGLPGLYLPALALVPVMWIILILISRG